MSSDLDIARCFEFAKKLTLQAGKILKCDIENEKVMYNKGKCDFVTNFDYNVEKIFIDALSREFPDHKIIAEETISATKKMPELTDAPTWFLDPIDGTINFIHSFPYFAISIALTVCKEPVLGIIYNPMSSELYSAIKGKGAFLNGKPIRTSKVTELKNAMLAIDPIHVTLLKNNKDIFKARFKALIQATQATRNIGACAMTLMFIARGILDCAQVDTILKPWDVAAGTLIIREAGGFVMDSKGGAYNIMKPDTIAAANETLAQEIFKLIVDTDLKTEEKRLKKICKIKNDSG